MSKLISNPTECGYYGKTHGKCFNPDHPQRKNALGRVLVTLPYCSAIPDSFPTTCPLQDGITMKDHLDRVLALSPESIKKIPTLKQTIHKCKKCGLKNSENCNTCDILNPQFK